MNNRTAGTGTPYWFEWSVGLLYMVKMLNPDSGIKNVVLQSEDSQSLDDVVVSYEDGMVEYIQVKNTREDDKLTYSDMVEGELEQSYLYKYSLEWKGMETKNAGKNRVILFTNRKMGNRKYTPKQSWERPSLAQFWNCIKGQAGVLDKNSDEHVDINKIVVKKEWEEAWSTWKNCMRELNAEEQLLFLQNFELISDQEDLDELIISIANELEVKFKTTHEKAVSLHQKLCYQLMWWATTIGKKKEIEKEDVMEALSLSGDDIKGEHFFPICEPFFQSRVTFVTELENKILNGKSRVIFITGNPGCGKTNIVSYLACKPNSIVTLRFHTFKPIIPGDLYVSADLGISDPKDFWGNLLIMLRKQFKGRLYKYSVPISIELIDSVDVLRNEVLRLASAWSDISGKPTVIAVDGIDHAARSGSANTFLRTLPTPETIPENVRFIFAGQPTHQFSEYPDFLSDLERIEEVQVPDIDKGDLELLYEKNSVLMKYDENDKKLLIDYIAEIAKGSTLSAVFAMQEATKYNDFTDFEQNSNVKRLNAGIQSYYEYIWKTAIQQVRNIGYTIDMYLAATFSVINKRVSAQVMADMYGEGISVWQWEDILQSLFPIVIYDSLGYSVFHNDVRLFLAIHYKKARQLHPTISAKIANYLLNVDFDEKVKHEVIFKLLKEARQEEKYVDVFTCEYVMEAYLIKRDLREIRQQMLDTLAILPRIEDKRKIVKFSCAVSTMQQYSESLRWQDRVYQCDIEIPFALECEKKPVVEGILSIEDFKAVFRDIDILVRKGEITRAKQILIRWMDKRIPGKLFGVMEENNEKSIQVNELLENWGKYARKFGITPEKMHYEEKAEESAAAYFYRGWIKEAVNYTGKDQLKYTFENISCYFCTDIENFVQQVIKRGRMEDVEFVLNGKMRMALSERNRISACAWAVKNSQPDLCEDWLIEINDKKFEYISEKWYEQTYTEIEKKKERFKIIADLMYVLTYVSKEKFNELRTKAIEKSGFSKGRNDTNVAGNLLTAVNQIAYIEQCILFRYTEKVKKDDFDALLDVILEDRYYNGFFDIDTMSFRKKILASIIRIINGLPSMLQKLLEDRLCAKAETCSGIALLETYWRFLYVRGNGNVIEEFFDAWMGPTGMIWKEELSERNYISDVLLKIAEEMNWTERIQRARELLNARSIGYVGRKDYSLFNPLQWFERIAAERSEVWKDLGSLLMNISEYASSIGDNRAFVQIRSTVSNAAAKVGTDSFFQFIQTIKKANQDWEEIAFDGLISVLENALFTKEELIQLWEKTVNYFPIDEYAKPYDSQNTRHKIYCSDVHRAISLCIHRLGYTGLEKRMEQMAPREYAQRRLERSEHSCIIPGRWYESEYYENVYPFIDVAKELDCDEMFKYIETQYGQSGFSWDYIKYFVEKAKKCNPQSILKYKLKIIQMIKEREINPLEYDGCNRLYEVLFPYLTDEEVANVLENIICTYYHLRDKGWQSKDFGLMTDLEHFTFALYSRYGIEDNIWALQEILKMHCLWINGTEKLEIENIYQVREEEHILGWSDFWDKLDVTGAD
ncbi:ATP-binding protein [Lactonifactor longoviformis]|uniref:ATP-binding protein n=1 Tax=Lactonifactor longoviformis TaxID=341220 RepID=UPI0036F1B295